MLVSKLPLKSKTNADIKNHSRVKPPWWRHHCSTTMSLRCVIRIPVMRGCDFCPNQTRQTPRQLIVLSDSACIK